MSASTSNMKSCRSPRSRTSRSTSSSIRRKRLLLTDGRYDLINKTNAPINAIHVRKGPQALEWLKLDVAGAHLVMDDPEFGYRIYRFDKPLAPGATTALTFRSRLWRRGFPAFNPQTDIIENGTFVNNSAFAPVIGMSRDNLLSDRTQRRRQHLPAELRMAKLEDMSATAHNYIGSDWVTARIRLTTAAGQTPIAPGARVSDVTSDGRRTATFVASTPILNFFSIQSANYKVASQEHNGIKLSVFYTAGHDWNVPKMLTAMGTALDYYRSHFGPYQFSYARIIEFPGYNSFAQAFAGTMPYSESIGFNANTNDPTKIDWTTYVVAHEMSHQYWAHQIIGADMQGGTLTSETLAQYSALMVMKHMYGPDKIRRFLKYELDSYLRGRQAEAIEEVPLERVENQQYIHYRKGAVAMYLLQERLGEEAVDRALSRFLAKWRFKGPPYPRSLDLIAEFRKEAKTSGAAAADHRLVREDHPLRPQGRRRGNEEGRRRLDDDDHGQGGQVLRQRQGRRDSDQARRADRDRPVRRPARPRRFLGEGCDRDGAKAHRERHPADRRPQQGQAGVRGDRSL